MIVCQNIEQIPQGKQFNVIIGNFDGFHRGHEAVLAAALNKDKLETVVICFRPHPKEIFIPETFKRVQMEFDLIQVLKKHNPNFLLIQHFAPSFRLQTDKEFLTNWLSKINIKNLIVGFDFNFGKGAKGDVKILSDWCKDKNIELTVHQPIQHEDLKISSSALRRFLSSSNFTTLENYLGYKYFISGYVEKGSSIGRTMSFPTANITVPKDNLALNFGVYITQTIIKGTAYPSISNFGKRPTVDKREGIYPVLETYLLDKDVDLYNSLIKIEFLKFIRLEKKFSSLDELKYQIIIDVKEAIKFHEENSKL